MTVAADLPSGTRLVSMSCATQVIVVREPSTPVHITCGSNPMKILDATSPRPIPQVTHDAVNAVEGMHYSDPRSGLEVLCTQSGAGPLAADGRTLCVKHVISI